MKNYLYLFLLSIIAFCSCEGRITKTQALKQSVEKYSSKEIKLEIKTYYPEEYSEVKLDSSLSNGYDIKIKAFTNLNESIIVTKIKDTINYNNYYRNFDIDINVRFKNKVIINKTLNKQDISKLLSESQKSSDVSYLNNYVLRDISINNISALGTKSYIDIWYRSVIDYDTILKLQIVINKNGDYHIIKSKEL